LPEKTSVAAKTGKIIQSPVGLRKLYVMGPVFAVSIHTSTARVFISLFPPVTAEAGMIEKLPHLLVLEK